MWSWSFCQCFRKTKINAIGYEVSDFLVKLGNRKLKKYFKKVGINDIFKIIERK